MNKDKDFKEIADEAKSEVAIPADMTFRADDPMGTREGVTISNARSICAHYVNCRAVQITWQVGVYEEEGGGDEGGGSSITLLPDFRDCIFEECSFLELPDNAEIHFYGHNKLFDCQFKPTQKIVTDGEMEFYGCSEVHIVHAEEKSYNFNFADSDNVDFPNITLDNYSKYPTKITARGGSISLIQGTGITWSANIVGAFVTILGDSKFALYDLYSCQVQAADAIYLNNMVGCVFYFNGPATTRIEIYGLLLEACEIRNGTPEEDLFNKAGVGYGAEIVIGNRPNMSGIEQVALSGWTKVVIGNYNGYRVLNPLAASAIDAMPEAESIFKPEKATYHAK